MSPPLHERRQSRAAEPVVPRNGKLRAGERTRDPGVSDAPASAGAQTRLHAPSWCRAATLGAVVLAALTLADAGLAGGAAAQDIMKRLTQPKNGATAKMFLESDQVVYDNKRNTVTAVGKVEIRYNGYTLTAARVTFHRVTKRVVAEGSARLVEPQGNVINGETIDVTDNFRDGFVTSLAIDTTERSRFSAGKADRRDGSVTVFENGVYSACQTCVNEPNKPPFWQIRAAKIIHNQQEKTVYYEDAKLEFLGTPIAYVPYFSLPDPTVARKTGFLAPGFLASSTLGFGMQAPYFWAPTHDWDATLAPTLLSRQGLLGDVEVRNRLETGKWSVRLVGINQNDPGAFSGTSGDRVSRGAVFTKGEFNINEQWKWGWDAVLLSDRKFLLDYKLIPSDKQEATSTIYMTGKGERNYFDARIYQFQVFEDDYYVFRKDNGKPLPYGRFLEQKQPLVAPVIDYDFVYPDSVMGGELAGRFNFTSLSRLKTDIDQMRQVYGASGNYTRMSADVTWRRQYIDSIGQIFTPFLGLRADLFSSQSTNPHIGWVDTGTYARIMPTVGIEYRYPFIANTTFGNHIFEPIAQLVARPNEQYVGHLPNEDAQSFVFDTSNLFDPDKFSGFDRAEGATRANMGFRYTFLPTGGGSVTVLAGQSYLLAGTNSFADPQIARIMAMDPRPLTGYGSGLDTDRSDYVTSIAIDTGRGFRFGSSARFDNRSLALNRAEVQATGTSGPLSGSLTYAYLRTPQYYYNLLNNTPYQIGKLDPAREEVQSALNLRMAQNWRLFGGIRYDVENSFVVNNTLGLGFDNDSFSASLAYTEDTDRALTKSKDSRILSDRVLYFRFGLRTIGDGAVSNSLMR
jgi:LPS-assembly protein